jgi:hypothetical protein
MGWEGYLHHLVSEHRKVSLLSVAGKRRIHHATEEKGQENT